MHCIERALERYGVELTVADVANLEGQIRTGRALLVRKNNDASAVWLVKHGDLALVAVFGPSDRRGHAGDFIITFLPEDAVRKGSQARRFSRNDVAMKGGRWRRRHG